MAKKNNQLVPNFYDWTKEEKLAAFNLASMRKIFGQSERLAFCEGYETALNFDHRVAQLVFEHRKMQTTSGIAKATKARQEILEDIEEILKSYFEQPQEQFRTKLIVLYNRYIKKKTQSKEK